MPDAALLLQIAFGGLSMGAVYALLAVSLVMVYKVSRIVCFAQGEFFVIGGLTLSALTNEAAMPLWAAFLATLALAGVLRVFAERTLIRPGRPERVGTVTGTATACGAFLSAQVRLVIGASVVVFVLLRTFFERTTLGLAMRAAAETPTGARLVGISVTRLTQFGWASGVALGALAGMLIAPVVFLTYASGTMPMVKAFVAMVVGGLSSTAGALAGGFLVGLLEACAIGFVSSEFADAIVFLFLIGFLLVRPGGLFGNDAGGCATFRFHRSVAALPAPYPRRRRSPSGR